jgi:hypothetical protein
MKILSITLALVVTAIGATQPSTYSKSPDPSPPDSANTIEAVQPVVTNQDLIVLKSGTLIKGKITKYEPLMVRVADSTVITLNMNDVLSISREPIAPSSAHRSRRQDRYTSADDFPTAIRSRQGQWRLFGGMSLPTGDLGSTSGAHAGSAQTGYALGLDGSFGTEVVRFTLGVMLSVNGTDLSSDFKAIGATCESGSWTSLWCLMGCRVYGTLAPDTRIHGDVQLGTLYGLSPEIEASASSGGYRITVKQESAGAVAFAYGVGLGLSLSHFDIAVRYLSATPEYEFLASTSGSYYSGTSKSKYKQPTSVFLLTAGVNF